MTVRHDFLFLGGHPVLDLLNTQMIIRGEPVDALSDPEALRKWLVASKLVGKTAQTRVTTSILRDVKRLRGHVRAIVDAMADGKKPEPAPVSAINRQLRRGPGSLALRQDGARFVFGFEPARTAATDLRFLIAHAAAEFLAGADRSRVRRCHGAQCILLYYDTTKSGTRRWCSMAWCGNRQKAAAHYLRVRRRASQRRGVAGR
jgi:predicted RNA-binding Zn ribbon-like protein